MRWLQLDERMTPDHLGFIPSFVSDADPRPAAEQFDANYRHGGGWRHFDGFEFNRATRTLRYPGDPSMRPLAMAALRDETIFVYPHAWVLIMQKDGSFEVSRLD